MSAAASDWTIMLAWAATVIAGYPIVTILLSETTRRSASDSNPDTGRFLRVLQYTVLPSVVVWILLHKLTSLPADNLAIKVIDTVVGILILHAVLLVAQAALMALRTRMEGGITAPKLFYELGGLVIAVVGGAMIISEVWDIELGTLFGALGVGSVVLGLALQSVIGGLANGLIVLSGRHFAIGDWLEVDDNFAKIVQVDWRSVTLESDGIQLVVPSSKLSSSTLRIRHGQQPVIVRTSLTVSSACSPEFVKSALIEAADSVDEAVLGSANSAVEEYSSGGIEYWVAVSVDDPTKTASVRAKLLERIWYVCHRRGISLTKGTEVPQQASEEEIAERAQLLIHYGSLRENTVGLTEMAAETRLERYAAGEYLQRRNMPARTMFVLISGSASLRIETLVGSAIIERLETGQIFIIRELFRNANCPVNVVADSESEVLAVPSSALQALLDRNRKLATELGQMIDTRTDLIKTMGGNHANGVRPRLQ